MNGITIQSTSEKDLPEIKRLFVNTIEAVCSADYTPDQIDAWTSSVHNEQPWRSIISNQYVLTAKINSVLVGFGTLKDGKHIDLFYVHKDYQGHYVASMILSEIENSALENGSTVLTSDVSITARLFFERKGFRTKSQQIVVLKGIEITNYKMSKTLKHEHIG